MQNRLWKSLRGYSSTMVFAGAGVCVSCLLTVSSLWDKGRSVSSAFGLQTNWWNNSGWRNCNENLIKATSQLSMGNYFMEKLLSILFLSLAALKIFISFT